MRVVSHYIKKLLQKSLPVSTQYYEQQIAALDFHAKSFSVLVTQSTLLLLPLGLQSASCEGRAAQPFLDLSPVL